MNNNFWVRARTASTARGTNTKMHTFYYTPEGARTRMYLYTYPDFYRFEMV